MESVPKCNFTDKISANLDFVSNQAAQNVFLLGDRLLVVLIFQEIMHIKDPNTSPFMMPCSICANNTSDMHPCKKLPYCAVHLKMCVP